MIVGFREFEGQFSSRLEFCVGAVLVSPDGRSVRVRQTQQLRGAVENYRQPGRGRPRVYRAYA